ncbi:HypC/HybG/HupF family hydrogenase formation chaperone [uncultured Ferrimonas sp.]|uniref:HypC/HybG/HupF family hydrogenase formation chaperone n=1 Tax=uncultured Ferrimonas sp. TaxID=432640 RepID=UPI00260B7384|nr:HypC/HybG/HupF family hydrogenase formation chaperone [uncultured Ferrimonas sp.]
MCLSIPSEVIAIQPEQHSATVDTLGVQRTVSTHLIAEPLAIGDYVLLHVGFAMNKIDHQTAQQNLALLQQMEPKHD